MPARGQARGVAAIDGRLEPRRHRIGAQHARARRDAHRRRSGNRRQMVEFLRQRRIARRQGMRGAGGPVERALRERTGVVAVHVHRVERVDFRQQRGERSARPQRLQQP